jgi:preprotein translocase SecF subunit
VTRLIFNATVPESREKPFKMFQIFKSPNFDFLKPAKLCITTSLGIIVVTCGIFLVRAISNPASVMTVDFVGGTAITYSYKEKASVGDIRGIVQKVVSDSTIQYQSSLDKTSDRLLIMTSITDIGGENSSKRILKELNAGLPASEFQLVGEDTVGAVVGKDLKRAAFWATLLSLIGMLIYISLRFEFGFALGAVIALAHDALFTLGVYSLFGHQMSLTAMAALLTVIGYSINDSIVILDRIREDLRKDAKMDFKLLCNRAINATLSRTVLTSGTTLFVILALYLFGGGAINDFALMMLVGVIVGSYSSVFIATPITLYWYRGRRPSFAVSK